MTARPTLATLLGAFLLLVAPAIGTQARADDRDDKDHCRSMLEQAYPSTTFPAAAFWTNPLARSPGTVSGLEFRANCDAGEPRLSMRARTYCRPRDCTLGWASVTIGDSGRMSARYVTFSAVREITFRLEAGGYAITARIEREDLPQGDPDSVHRARFEPARARGFRLF